MSWSNGIEERKSHVFLEIVDRRLERLRESGLLIDVGPAELKPITIKTKG